VKNDSDFLPRIVRHMKIWKAKNPKQYIINKARCRAKRKRVPFNLTVRDIRIPKKCPVLGIPVFWGDERKSDNSPSLDCFIPRYGYVSGNVFVISMRANRLKGDASLSEVKKIARWMRRIFDAQGH
jgi:hypothetical protein